MTTSLRTQPFFFISGGCRSGKSAYAQKIAEQLSPTGLYIATAGVYDDEMRERVEQHKASRGSAWRSYEVPPGTGQELYKQIATLCKKNEVVLLDCLTLWASGCMNNSAMPENFSQECENLLAALWELPCPVIVVSNELGMGLVPATPAGRVFRDMAGMANQMAARMAKVSIFMVSGLPLAVKGSLPRV